MPCPALRGTLRSGPKQLIDEFAIRILLMMLIITLYSVLCENERIFSLAPAPESIMLFLDNWSVFILSAPDLFN